MHPVKLTGHPSIPDCLITHDSHSLQCKQGCSNEQGEGINTGVEGPISRVGHVVENVVHGNAKADEGYGVRQRRKGRQIFQISNVVDEDQG